MVQQKSGEPAPMTRRPQRRKIRSHATPGLWKGLREWGKDGRLVGFLLAAGSAAALGYFLLHPAFRVATVEVRGNAVLPREQALRASQALGTNLFLLDPSAVSRRLREIPYVQDARVERRLPDQVVLTIVEHFPSVSWWSSESLDRYLIDDSGLVLGPEPPGVGNLIYIADLDKKPIAPQQYVDAEAVRTAQQVFARLYSDLGIRLKAFAYRKGQGVSAVAIDGSWEACFGYSDHLEEKVKNLVRLLNSGISFQWADLRALDHIIYR